MTKSICVVKVGTESFQRGGVHFHGRSVRVLRKQTTYDLLGDEVDSIGSVEAFQRIINLNCVDDGVYQLACCNLSRDWETGIIDDYDLQLIPYGVIDESKRGYEESCEMVEGSMQVFKERA